MQTLGGFRRTVGHNFTDWQTRPLRLVSLRRRVRISVGSFLAGGAQGLNSAQFGDAATDAFDEVFDGQHAPPRRVAQGFAQQQLRVAEQTGEWIVDVVTDARDEFRHLLQTRLVFGDETPQLLLVARLRLVVM